MIIQSFLGMPSKKAPYRLLRRSSMNYFTCLSEKALGSKGIASRG